MDIEFGFVLRPGMVVVRPRQSYRSGKFTTESFVKGNIRDAMTTAAMPKANTFHIPLSNIDTVVFIFVLAVFGGTGAPDVRGGGNLPPMLSRSHLIRIAGIAYDNLIVGLIVSSLCL